MDEISFVDWNGNGRIDPSDIALSMAIAEEMIVEDENHDKLQ